MDAYYHTELQDIRGHHDPEYHHGCDLTARSSGGHKEKDIFQDKGGVKERGEGMGYGDVQLQVSSERIFGLIVVCQGQCTLNPKSFTGSLRLPC